MRRRIGSVVTITACLLVVSCSRRVDQHKFESVYRAGKAIEGSLAVGVTYMKFTELVQSFATEVSVAKDKAANPAERQLVELYGEALTGCTDSLTVWKLKIENPRDTRIDVSDNADVRGIIDTYAIQDGDPHAYSNLEPSGAMHLIWARVGAKLAAANRLYNGESASTAGQ
jgi:hypothetical protein